MIKISDRGSCDSYGLSSRSEINKCLRHLLLQLSLQYSDVASQIIFAPECMMQLLEIRVCMSVCSILIVYSTRNRRKINVALFNLNSKTCIRIRLILTEDIKNRTKLPRKILNAERDDRSFGNYETGLVPFLPRCRGSYWIVECAGTLLTRPNGNPLSQMSTFYPHDGSLAPVMNSRISACMLLPRRSASIQVSSPQLSWNNYWSEI